MDIAGVCQINSCKLLTQYLARTQLTIIQYSLGKKNFSRKVLYDKQKDLFFCAEASKLHTAIDTNYAMNELYEYFGNFRFGHDSFHTSSFKMRLMKFKDCNVFVYLTIALD